MAETLLEANPAGWIDPVNEFDDRKLDSGFVLPPEDRVKYDNGGEDPDEIYTDPDTGTTERLPKTEQRLSQLDKLKLIYEEFSFIPGSREEMTAVWSLRAYQDQPGFAARYLNIILLHQKKEKEKAGKSTAEATEEAQRTVRKLARQWGEYRNTAQSDRYRFHRLDEFAAQYPSISTEELLNDYADGEPSVAKRTYADLNVRGGIFDMIYGDKDVKQPYKVAEQNTSIKTLDRDGLQTAIWRAIVLDERRANFWQTVLRQAHAHEAAKPAVREFLDSSRPR